MLVTPQIPLHRLVLSLSEAIDQVNPSVADHQLHVAYISIRLGRLLGFRGPRLRDLFHAAALHDIGVIRSDQRVRFVACNQLENGAWHADAGYLLLKDNEFFHGAAPAVRHHHASWRHGQGAQSNGHPVPTASFIVALADTVDRCLRRDVPILSQYQRIREIISHGQKTRFPPEHVAAFLQVSQAPSFWLDLTSKRLYSILAQQVDWPTIMIDESAVKSIAQIFGRIVDSLSPWTGTHSAGVAAAAAALAERLNFAPRELILMRAAGYLHDLGKITVPSEILDKNDRPTPDEWAILKGHTYHTFRILDTIGGMPQISEWAAFHHERLDGQGYPFGLGDKDLTLGARIMAVADTFTAVAEDRPYRPGMSRDQALAVLDKLVANGGQDGDVVAALRADYDAIDALRRREQAAYAVKQALLARLLAHARSTPHVPTPPLPADPLLQPVA